MPSSADASIIKQILSAARLSTFEERGSSTRLLTESEALELYTWNIQISSAFLNPLHIGEVVLRNAVSGAIETKFGDCWPWSTGFERSLPSQGRYCQRRDLQMARQSMPSTGKVIPEVKFVFWQKMFTSRHQQRLWDGQIHRLFPSAPSMTEAELRQELYDGLEHIRRLRNRIAHHEPIFTRDLTRDFQLIESLIRWRCTETADWMLRNQDVRRLRAGRQTGRNSPHQFTTY